MRILHGVTSAATQQQKQEETREKKRQSTIGKSLMFCYCSFLNASPKNLLTTMNAVI